MTDRLERLINLVIALRETRVPMSADDVRTRVAGYGHSEHAAFRRMFERDKADLRALGVPVETTPIDRFAEQQGYRIDPKRYDLPEVHLEADELAALALALRATGLLDEAASGLRKLEVDAGRPGAARELSDPGLGVSLDAPHRDELLTAQLTRTPVRFRYRPQGREAADRVVDPHALVHRGGRWYLVGHDHDRGERRAFRLDRIVGAVTTCGEPDSFPTPPETAVDDVVPPPPRGGPETAEVLVHPELSWLVARRARGGGRPRADGWTAFTVVVGDPADFVRWVLELGAGVEVRSPAQVRASVIERLEEAASKGVSG